MKLFSASPCFITWSECLFLFWPQYVATSTSLCVLHPNETKRVESSRVAPSVSIQIFEVFTHSIGEEGMNEFDWTKEEYFNLSWKWKIMNSRKQVKCKNGCMFPHHWNLFDLYELLFFCCCHCCCCSLFSWHVRAWISFWRRWYLSKTRNVRTL